MKRAKGKAWWDGGGEGSDCRRSVRERGRVLGVGRKVGSSR